MILPAISVAAACADGILVSVNLLGALAKVSSFTLMSRITGLVREFLIARAFGASLYTDAFFVAFRIPNLLRRLFAEGRFRRPLCRFWHRARMPAMQPKPDP